MIKVIALDIDGTILNSERKMTEATKKAVKEAMERGIKIIIASGRPYCGAKEYAEELGLFERGGYVLCFNGSRIIDCVSGDIVYDIYLEDEVKGEICEILKGYEGAVLMTYKGEDILLAEDAQDEGVKLGAQVNNLELVGVCDMRKSINHRITKFILGGDADYIGSIWEDVKERIGSLATVCRSEATLLEIMPFGVDKGIALKGFMEKMGIDKDEVLACGDGYNDDTMLQYAGIGVAMGNAFPEIKALADYVTLTNDEDGVAYAIRKFVLDKE